MIYNIMDYGAVPDGHTDCTLSIQSAIDACAVTGGVVNIPAGKYLSGMICLKSNVELHLEQGAVLISDVDSEDEKYFLYACHEENITISGQGTIDGQGRKRFVDDNADYGAHECPLNVNGNRPRTSYFEDVEQLTVCDITFRDAAFWTLHMAGCRNVIVDSIRILNNDRGPNNDGIDPDCCQNVLIRNCIISTGDDAIVVKTSRQMTKLYGSCENVSIQGCILHSRDSALKIGTETWGDIRNITLSDCLIQDCSRGVGIWSRDGGEISNVFVHHISGNTRQYADCPERSFAPRWWGKGEPIFLSTARRKNDEGTPGQIHHVYFEQMRISAEAAIFIGGEMESCIRDIFIRDSDFVWSMRSGHIPALFDEQPSIRDVYPHEMPCVYARNAENVVIEAGLTVEDSMAKYIMKQSILEDCENFVITERK